MATLYFNGAVDNEWTELGNWWMDDAFTTQATSLPTSVDDVIASASITSNSGSEPTVANFTLNSGYLQIAVTVTGNATFTNSGNSGTITGNATFSDGSYNSGTITGNATFNGRGANYGNVTGNATFNGLTAIAGNVNVSGSFFGNGIVGGLIKDSLGNTITNWTFSDGSVNYGHLTGDATFNGSSYNDYSTVSGNATFNDSSYNGGDVGGNATFNDSSYNGGYVSGNATFNDSSSFQLGQVVGDTTFNDGASTGEGVVSFGFSNVVHNGTSYNQSTVYFYGDSSYTFNDSSFNTGTVGGSYGSLTVTYNGFTGTNSFGKFVNGQLCRTLYFNGAVDGEWTELGNWWTDDTFTTQATSLPTSVDDVIASASITSNSGSEPTVANLTMTGGAYAGATITVTIAATFDLASAATQISNSYSGSYGSVSFAYEKGINGSSILGVV